MVEDMELLTTSEAAVVAGVDIPRINRLFDEHTFPEELLRNEATRRVQAGACALIRFYYSSADVLTADERKYAIDHVFHMTNRNPNGWIVGSWKVAKPIWSYRRDYFDLDLNIFIEETMSEYARLAKAREIVVEDPKILGGAAVIKGTRAPVYDIAASANAGLSIEEIKEDYPSVSEDQIKLAILYAKATPLRGRPKASDRSVRHPTSTRKVYSRRPK